MIKLPKIGTSIEELECLVCKKKLKEILENNPDGKIDCDRSDCPQTVN